MPRRRRKVPVTIYLTREQVDALAKLNAETRVPQANYIREGIDAVLEKYEAVWQPAVERAAEGGDDGTDAA